MFDYLPTCLGSLHLPEYFLWPLAFLLAYPFHFVCLIHPSSPYGYSYAARYLQACRPTHQSHFQFTYQALTYLPAQLSNLFTKLTYLFAWVQGRLLTEARVLAQWSHQDCTHSGSSSSSRSSSSSSSSSSSNSSSSWAQDGLNGDPDGGYDGSRRRIS